MTTDDSNNSSGRVNGPRNPNDNRNVEDDIVWQQLFNNGVRSIQEGNAEQGIRYLTEAAHMRPDNIKVLSILGMVHAQQRHFEPALAIFDKLLELDPKNEKVWSNRGVILRSLGHMEEANYCFEMAIFHNPNYEVAWYNKGFIYDSMGIYKNALAHYKKALEINPTYQDALTRKKECLDKLALEKSDQYNVTENLEMKQVTPYPVNEPARIKSIDELYEMSKLELLDYAVERNIIVRPEWSLDLIIQVIRESHEIQTIIEEIFVIYEDGALISHNTRRINPNMDNDILASMLVAVQEFVKDSFREEEHFRLNKMQFGEKTILIEKGMYIFIAVIIRGKEPPGLSNIMQQTINEIEADYGFLLPDWDRKVTDLRGVSKYLKKLLNYSTIHEKIRAHSGHNSTQETYSDHSHDGLSSHVHDEQRPDNSQNSYKKHEVDKETKQKWTTEQQALKSQMSSLLSELKSESKKKSGDASDSNDS